MPEVKHGENALLGESGAGIARLLRQAVEDPGLARRLGEGARRTYDAVYRPEVIAKALLARAQAAA
jgi:glycosyltransferase involved in cell wall biosynthesis